MSFRIDGAENPDLFLPFELFGQLLRGVDWNVPAIDRDVERAILAPKIKSFGYEPGTFWAALGTVSKRYFEVRDGTQPSASSHAKPKAAQHIALCRERQTALAAARSYFGHEKFDRFLYQVVAPTLSSSSRAPDEAQGLRYMAGGCRVNGATVDYSYSSGTAFGRYPLRLTAISNFSDGNVSITAKACSGTGVCAQNSANMNRFTPSPGTASSTIYATWLEEDEGSEELGPVYIPRSASYSHGIRQLYTTTVFTCSEIGESSHYQVKDSLVTISGQDPMPVWGSTVEVRGTISWWISYRLTESANPVGCTFPVICSSKAGGVAGAFGYAPSVHEVVSPFTIDGQAAVITNGSVDITFQ